MGRPPKPRELKTIEGNPGKRPIPAEMESPLADYGKPPRTLKGDAKKAWDRIAEMRIPWIKAADLDALATYCELVADCMKYRKKVATKGGDAFLNGAGVLVRSPWAISLSDAEKRKLQYATALGLNPAARQKVAASLEEPKQQDKERQAKIERIFGT